MNDQNFTHFEAQLERLIEGAFAQLFGKTVRAQDIALQLARAMQAAAEDDAPNLLAPDHYIISLHPSVCTSLLERQPDLPYMLGQHLIELAVNSGYKLDNQPQIELVPDATLSTAQVNVNAQHHHHDHATTAVMQAATLGDIPAQHQPPANAQLIVNGKDTYPLTGSIINIGRSRDNHISLDDPYISRHHAQIRLRFGHYLLFDIQSQSGTFVNDVRIREHQLKTGDVMRMGRVQIVYLQDDQEGDSHTNAAIFEP